MLRALLIRHNEFVQEATMTMRQETIIAQAHRIVSVADALCWCRDGSGLMLDK